MDDFEEWWTSNGRMRYIGSFKELFKEMPLKRVAKEAWEESRKHLRKSDETVEAHSAVSNAGAGAEAA